MKLFNIILCASLSTLPLLANAGDLKVANNTKYDLSFRVNGVCSNNFDGFGVIPAGTIKIISEKAFDKECKSNPKNCVAIVYKKPSCKGNDISAITFDTSYGVSSVSSSTYDPITITANGFNLIFTTPIK